MDIITLTPNKMRGLTTRTRCRCRTTGPRNVEYGGFYVLFFNFRRNKLQYKRSGNVSRRIDHRELQILSTLSKSYGNSRQLSPALYNEVAPSNKLFNSTLKPMLDRLLPLNFEFEDRQGTRMAIAYYFSRKSHLVAPNFTNTTNNS